MPKPLIWRTSTLGSVEMISNAARIPDVLACGLSKKQAFCGRSPDFPQPRKSKAKAAKPTFNHFFGVELQHLLFHAGQGADHDNRSKLRTGVPFRQLDSSRQGRAVVLKRASACLDLCDGGCR